MLYGTPTLLLHGDLLCTDDTAYQQFRAQTRDPQWQAQFLAQPLAARLAFAAQARAASQARHGELRGQGHDGNHHRRGAGHRRRPGSQRFGLDAHDPRPHAPPGDP